MTRERNRGKDSNDDVLFGSKKSQLKLKEAIVDMHYLLSRGYAEKSSLQLVGNKHRLSVRQQQAVRGMSASHEQIERREQHVIPLKKDNVSNAYYRWI